MKIIQVAKITKHVPFFQMMTVALLSITVLALVCVLCLYVRFIKIASYRIILLPDSSKLNQPQFPKNLAKSPKINPNIIYSFQHFLTVIWLLPLTVTINTPM